MARRRILVIVLVVLAVLLVLVLAPNLLRWRYVEQRRPESSGIGWLRVISTAELAYSQTYPQVGFTCSLASLGPPPAGAPISERASGLIDAVAASGQKSGYRIQLRGCDGPPAQHYQVFTEPLPSRGAGQKAFCSDQSGVIRYSADGKGESCLAQGVVLQ